RLRGAFRWTGFSRRHTYDARLERGRQVGGDGVDTRRQASAFERLGNGRMNRPGNLARELLVATELAERAAELELGYFGSTSLSVEHKPGEGPVTRADREADRLIVDGLRAAFPSDGVLSEEAPDDGSRHRAERVWMVDPIDGTNDFIRGHSGFAVMIGLLVD